MGPGWNYIVGPEDGEGIRLYLNGVLAGSDVTKLTGSAIESGNGRVVVGRVYINNDDQYGAIDVDELLFFNQALSDEQILKIKNMI